MSSEELRVFAALLDGVEGFLCETGYSRYWDMDVIEQARRIVGLATGQGGDEGGE